MLLNSVLGLPLSIRLEVVHLRDNHNDHVQVLWLEHLGDFPEIVSHVTPNSSVILNKDEYAIQRLVCKSMAHNITVIVGVAFALAPWAVKNR